MPEQLTQDRRNTGRNSNVNASGTGKGFFDSGFNRSALHIIAGAAGAIGSKDGMEAMQRGVAIGSGLQKSYLREKEFENNRRRQDDEDVRRDERHDLDMQIGESRLEQAEASTFHRRLSTVQALTSKKTQQYRRNFYDRVTRRQPTDGTLTYPIDEPMADQIEQHTKSSETRSNMDALFFSMNAARDGSSPAAQKEAKFMSDVYLMKAGGTIIKGESGDFVKFDWTDKAYPVTMASAREIKKDLDIKLKAEEDKIVDLYKTRNLANSGAQIHILNRLNRAGGDNSVIGGTEKALFAEQYAKEIAQSPLQTRSMGMAHSMKRLLSGQDKESSQFERAELVKQFEKAGIKWDQYKTNGKFVINGKQMNDYFNKFNDGPRITVAPEDEQVIVNDRLIKMMFDNSGLNNLSDKYVDKAVQFAGQKEQQIKAQMQAKFGAQMDEGRRDNQLAFEKKRGLAQVDKSIISDDIKSGAFSKYSYGEIIDNGKINIKGKDGKPVEVNARQVPGLVERIDYLADKKFGKEISRKTNSAGLQAKYRNEFGMSLKHVLLGSEKDKDGNPVDDNGEGAARLKQALRWVSEQKEDIKKQYDGRKLESMKKSFYRTLQRNPDKWIKDQLNSDTATWQSNAFQEIEDHAMARENKKATQKKSSFLDSTLGPK